MIQRRFQPLASYTNSNPVSSVAISPSAGAGGMAPTGSTSGRYSKTVWLAFGFPVAPRATMLGAAVPSGAVIVSALIDHSPTPGATTIERSGTVSDGEGGTVVVFPSARACFAAVSERKEIATLPVDQSRPRTNASAG